MVTRSIPKPGVYSGVFPIRRQCVAGRRTPPRCATCTRLRERVRALEKKSDIMTMDIHEILKKLPHRYPFLLVDRVLELEHGKRIKALKNVTDQRAVLPRPFPAPPVMPGVLMLEALAQAAALLSFDAVGRAGPTTSTVYYFAGIDAARFKRPVEPGDQLILDVDARRA